LAILERLKTELLSHLVVPAAHPSSVSHHHPTRLPLASTGVTSPADSPPDGNHSAIPNSVSNGLNAAMKNQMAIRHVHMRHAARITPYPRDTHSHSGSEAEQDELALYLPQAITRACIWALRWRIIFPTLRMRRRWQLPLAG
jgi:hypothetical protein